MDKWTNGQTEIRTNKQLLASIVCNLITEAILIQLANTINQPNCRLDEDNHDKDEQNHDNLVEFAICNLLWALCNVLRPMEFAIVIAIANSNDKFCPN